MFDHIGISVSNFENAKTFYDKALAPLGYSLVAMVPETFTNGVKVGGYGKDRPQFWLSEGAAQTPPIHFAFSAISRADVIAFYEAAIAAGGRAIMVLLGFDHIIMWIISVHLCLTQMAIISKLFVTNQNRRNK